MLLTSIAVEGLEKCQEMIRWDTCRWEIEIYFKVLKSGCGVQEIQFEKPEQLEACLAVYMIIAWRVMIIEMLSRSAPEIHCSVIFDEQEWKSVYAIVEGKKPPEKAPMLKPFVDMLASLCILDEKATAHRGQKRSGSVSNACATLHLPFKH